MSSDHQLQPGLYQIHTLGRNSETVLDLSGGDLKSILGFPAHQGPNQKWELLSLGKGYSIRSLHSGEYLTIEEGLRDMVPVVASPYPVSWVLSSLREGVWSIVWPNTKFAVGLPHVVDGEPNMLARLVNIDGFRPESLWQFIPEAASTTSNNVLHSTVQVPTTVTDVKAIDDGNFTITTTTTLVTTTVVKVAKTAAS